MWETTILSPGTFTRLMRAAASLPALLETGLDVGTPALVVSARTGDPALFARALLAAPAADATRALRDQLGAAHGGVDAPAETVRLGMDAFAHHDGVVHDDA